MYRTERQPAWQRDIAWASAVLLVLTVLAGTQLFTQAQLSTQSTGTEVIRSVLSMTLQPSGAEPAEVGVRAGASYQAGQPLTLLPGLEVFADATEIPGFTVEGAVGRIAGVLTDRLITSGSQTLLASIGDPVIAGQFQTAVNGPVAALMRGALEAEMLPSGLDDGSRMADWRAQQAANPGNLVQPIVGIFVYESPNRLAQMNARQIGVSVIGQLADQVLEEGLASATALITNQNLGVRLQTGVDVVARSQIHQLFGSLIAGRAGELESRLAEARAVAAGQAESETSGLSGLLPASQLAGLTPEQANEAVLDALAQRAYQGGSAIAAAQLTRPEQATKVRGVGGVIDAFSARAHGRYTGWTTMAGVIALVLAALLVGFSRGALRLVNLGLALAIAVAPGAWLFSRLGDWLPQVSSLPAGAQAQGVLGAISGLTGFAYSNLPTEIVSLAARNHLYALLFAGVLVVLALLLWLMQGMRPRRRY